MRGARRRGVTNGHDYPPCFFLHDLRAGYNSRIEPNQSLMLILVLQVPKGISDVFLGNGGGRLSPDGALQFPQQAYLERMQSFVLQVKASD